MLRLASATPTAWVERADNALPLLLVDHAHCEKKAASTAINLLFRYPHHPFLARTLAALAEEELQHFQQVLDLLDARDLPYHPITPAPYAARLMKRCRREEPARLVDTLLCCALIEARSCERMRQLSEGLSDPALRTVYGNLLASEARHHRTYVDLAAQAAGDQADEIPARLATLAGYEAEILAQDDPDFRFHSGCSA